jgi:hypothetical protein
MLDTESRHRMKSVKKVVINHLMRNMDLKLSPLEDQLFLFKELKTTNETIRLIATTIRQYNDSIHEYHAEDHSLLKALPLSLSSFAIAKADELKLVNKYTIDEYEDLSISLNIKDCKMFLMMVTAHIHKNEENYHTQFSAELNRESSFVTFD